MRKLLWIAALVPLAACGTAASSSDREGAAAASGSGTTRSFAVADFTGVDLRGHDDVIVRVGGGFSVRAEGPSDQLDKLDVRKDGATLRVGRIEDRKFNWGDDDSPPVKIYVTMPRIAAASVAGSGDLAIDRVSGGSFEGEIAGSGDLSVGAIRAEAAELSVAGAGGITIKGEVGALGMAIAGSGDIDARGLKAGKATVSIAGSGNARADVRGPASVSLMGSGDAELGANAKCRTTAMGGGTARCGG